jgi:outer membrane protein assembly complex protein YaeT
MKRSKYILITFFALLFATGYPNAGVPKKLKIKSVKFEGNQAFKDSRLHEVMVSRPSKLLEPSYYSEDALQDDLRNLTLFYRQRGYLQAGIVGHKQTVDTLKKQVAIRIQISEGPLTRVDSIGIIGNTVFPVKTLLKNSKLTPGSPFSLIELENTLQEILNHYSDRGYLEAHIATNTNIDTLSHLASIQLILQENSQFTVDQIRIKGLEKTSSKIVLRELTVKSNEILNTAKLADSQHRLYGTGLFRSVFIRPKTSTNGDSTQKDLLVEVKEDRAGEFNVAFGYGTIEKLRGNMELSYRNLFGRALIAGVEATVSSRQQTVGSFLTEPWIFGIPWSASISALIGLFNEPGYSLEGEGAQLAFGHEFARRSTFQVKFETAFGRFKELSREFFVGTSLDTLPIEIQDLLADNLKFNADLESIEPTLIFDKRNNILNPKNGSYIQVSTSFSRSFVRMKLFDLTVDESTNFLRNQAIFKYFYSPNIATTLASSIEVGMINVLSGSPESIPPSERFFTGGPNSLRGFEYQKVGPLDENGKPLGGRLKFVWNVFEIRHRVYRFIDGLVFLDAGNVWEAPENFDLGNIRSNIGFGMRLITPIGLLRLDYGINLDPRKNEPRGKFYFGLGHAF